ncbi:hypothetical protein GIB67_030452 [Kingdonia uniflora]|uniref:Uncharacterized protein n=1 Tax=Kingdonia uniflora TaxID=39325 RepID=A0A7J7P7V5_9MAGN|nr:hypothetical protein GIB67_030452 [Kingdonia uniflora]
MTEDIEDRLAGVPVYTLSNTAEEFVLVSNESRGKSLGLFCFKKEDAESLLEQMKVMDPGMWRGFQLQLEGVAFRFIPEHSQILNVLKSPSLALRTQDKTYRPVFFRKEDLEKSLLRASRQQSQLNPAFRQGNIQVSILEEIIKELQTSYELNWDDVVFIPPGFDISTDVSQQGKPIAFG